MKCTECSCINYHFHKCEINSTIGEMGLCEDFNEVTEANEAEQLSFEF